MPKKRLSEDAKLVIEGARKTLEDTARQTLELMEKREAMASDETARSGDWLETNTSVSILKATSIPS
jgi:hypothetical protein